MLNFDALRASSTRTTPYRYLVGEGVLTKEQAADIRRDYPDINEPGYLPLSKLEASGAFKQLIEDLRKPELADILSEKLDLDLKDKPRMITVRRLSKHGDGRIHRDSKSKICTMLIYLNEDWEDAQGGAIRALNNERDMEDYVEEVSPLAGNVFAFKRADNSWHGHPSYKGERYVVQTTFLISQAELDRKEQRGGFQTKLKRLLRIA
ncbi:2OG-Fe(II) oxygenase [Pseudovibrio sp. SPO723]|uniref:2OG-Fe(II) oxygenase n=1 Tax=Nesiotobacter zosterae TaxID=392721 RepID=UPI0029C43E7C|nr:2OG-Fe(II) oxygenase [Pseudovibrio sp. SPO723]MDX5593324.1 2OG-Fe(II) oxygenase [Pseudovibrio sp. SPO723]